MSSSPDPAVDNPAAAEQVLRRLEWTVIRRLDGLLHGDYRTLFRGPGLDLADIREYQYHDDVRHIDWNVTARLQTPYVREYNEEREIAAWFLVDLSPSVDFGSRRPKRTVALEFVSVLARLLTRHGNRVGALFYGESVDTVIPPKGGRRHVLGLVHRMLTRKPQARAKATDLRDFLENAAALTRRRALVFLVSDFMSDTDWGPALSRLSLRHEVVAVRLYDALEQSLPDLGMFLMQDAESGEQLFVDTGAPGFRRRFAEAAARHEERVRGAFSSAGVDALEVATEDDLADAILRFADLRKSRSRLSAGGSMPVHLTAAQGRPRDVPVA